MSGMAMDQRDWWVSQLRKRTRYKERASFRVNRGRQERREAWRGLALRAAALCVVVALVMYAVRLALRV